MPLYSFSFPCGKTIDRFFKMAECPEHLTEQCPCVAEKVIVAGHGGVLRDDPIWLDDSVRGALQDSDLIGAGKVKPIETRQELKNHLKANPDIVPVE